MANQFGGLAASMPQIPMPNNSWIDSLAGTIGSAIDKAQGQQGGGQQAVAASPAAATGQGVTFLQKLMSGIPQNQFAVNPAFSITNTRLGG